jgi:hypothetical protein
MKCRKVCLAACGALGLAISQLGVAAQAAPPPAGCAPDGALQFVCGPKNGEDILRLGSRWLLVSGMDGALTGSEVANGRLYLVDHQAKTWSEAFPGTAPVFRHDRELYGNCPGPVNTRNFSAHGLSLREHTVGHYRVYVTGHGTREAIEVFEVDATGAAPQVAWVGCVVLPEDVLANSVAILPDWGFVVTKFLDRRVPTQQAMAEARQGKPNGVVYEWHPGGKVQAIAGTEMSAPNGIEVSPDGDTLYVAAFGTREFVRFQRSAGGVKRDTIPLDITPDNIRWSQGGKLLTAGGNAPGAAAGAGWGVIEVDPATLATRRVAGTASSAGMQAISVGTDVGGEIWVGTFSGDRIGYVKAR